MTLFFFGLSCYNVTVYSYILKNAADRKEESIVNEKNFNDIVAHMKNSGFVYQGSEIYGGLANTWDFGPLGIELKK